MGRWLHGLPDVRRKRWRTWLGQSNNMVPRPCVPMHGTRQVRGEGAPMARWWYRGGAVLEHARTHGDCVTDAAEVRQEGAQSSGPWCGRTGGAARRQLRRRGSDREKGGAKRCPSAWSSTWRCSEAELCVAQGKRAWQGAMVARKDSVAARSSADLQRCSGGCGRMGGAAVLRPS